MARKITADDVNALAMTTDSQAKQLVEPYQRAVNALTALRSELESMQPSSFRAALALDYSREMKAVLARYAESDLRKQILALHRVHRFFNGMVRAKLIGPAEDFLDVCARIRSDWDVERRRRIEEDRRQKESQMKLDMEVERQHEVEHLKELGREDEAAELATRPIEVPTLNVDLDAGKPADEVMIESWRPKRDDHGDIVFSDLGAFLRWVAENPAFHYLVEARYGELKKLLTENRGLLQPPGLVVEHHFEPRTSRARPATSDEDETPFDAIEQGVES